jgi:hypothetical protein
MAEHKTMPDHHQDELEKRKEELKTFHQELIQAHFQEDLDFFTRDISQDYFSVSRAEIRHPSEKEIREQFKNYLGRTSFREYKDLQEPIIGISRDGSLGWSLVRVRVAGDQEGEDGSMADLDFTCAWITLFERQGEKWIRLGEVSSF